MNYDHNFKPIISIKLLTLAILTACTDALAQRMPEEYLNIRNRTAKGWNTWNTRSMLSHVLLPECLAVNIELKQPHKNQELYLKEALLAKKGERPETIVPGAHAWDGSYTSLRILWAQADLTVETAAEDNNLAIRIIPNKKADIPARVVFSLQYLWDSPGFVRKTGQTITGRNTAKIDFRVCNKIISDLNVGTAGPYLVAELDKAVYAYAGNFDTPEKIDSIIRVKKTLYENQGKKYGEYSKMWQAIQSCMAWNTIYDPVNRRPISTVNRIWNIKRGGYGIFCWDNFFGALICGLDNKNVAYINFIETLQEKTAGGFIPNVSQGNGRKSLDRSQPPVGSLVAMELYNKYGDKWFLETVYADLKRWNEWWIAARLNGDLLSWGSHPADNPWQDAVINNLAAAALESGMDDSPMYDHIPFDKNKNVMQLHDVGLNALYIADCRHLAQMAALLGRNTDAEQFQKTADKLSKNMLTLWDKNLGLFLNRRTDTQLFESTISPTHLYPLMAGIADAAQTKSMLSRIFSQEQLGGRYLLPSIARSHPDYNKQRYWKGSIWPPLNFLAYISLRNTKIANAERKLLVQKSGELFMKNYESDGFICENYSSIDGTCNDGNINSEPFYFWGCLLGLIELMEKGLY
jgi:hypothetical protein